MRIIRGEYGRRRFNVPANITARPTTDFARENIFNVIENRLDIEGIRALDLFGGTGAVTFELLSRGAAHVTCVEKAGVQAGFISKVAKDLGCIDRLTLIRGDVFKWIKTARGKVQPFDFIFADPPYDMPNFDAVAPAVLDGGLLAPDGLFILEHSAKRSYADLPAFDEHRAYGSVNFSLFIPASTQ